MAKKKKVAGADIDWYLISIDRLKQIGLVILLLILLGLRGWWYFTNQKRNPRSAAEAAIAEARQALNALARRRTSPAIAASSTAPRRNSTKPTTLLGGGKYPERRGRRRVADHQPGRAQRRRRARKRRAVPDVEGDVQFQKSRTVDWKRAEPRTPLFNGDWVKTGDNASAELIFSNVSLYTVGPNALLEIYAQFNPATSKKSNSVQMQIGSVEVATTDDASTVRTPGSQVVVDSDSTTQVGVISRRPPRRHRQGLRLGHPTDGRHAVKLARAKAYRQRPGAISPVRNLCRRRRCRRRPTTRSSNCAASRRSTSLGAGARRQPATCCRSHVRASSTTLEINSKRQKTTARRN